MQIGIIAGADDLPKIIASDAKKRGFKIITIAFKNLTSLELNEVSDEIKWVNVGKLGEMINALKGFGVKEVIMAGKTPKSLLYKSKITPDIRAMKLFFSLKDMRDDSILNAIADELERDDIRIVDTAAFSSHLLTPEGVLTRDLPADEEWRDIEFGWKIAKEIAKLDIGQTVVVKRKAVMAIEAIEGTDEAIRRGGRLAGEDAVVVKVSKPQQDMRLDVPVIGLNTLNSMINAGARVLAVEAGRSIIVNRKELAMEAENSGISIVGYRQ
ncbi:UDP-2,3-diacylglucosamine diphosphatase LpxI [Thermodesulfovibrionales bacterium]|nr:UDP-2,3-diacylglucosamine diphosphatase LpxI [Thermodesulfovibrionales bacterium]MCL0062129.1 UDP-2,3-diacylglucosamine diphosphatase LpxI [Thermodesulfovibrionales bacterium]MCL0068626.1 UDP-2,3-diacylglucosamine diphosphatase LpxI [Thermodesulfovibrionales bacterium]MCL0083678.1 UDP-2,3-diacylglucosamine diphosphatase LpxI [Thermodesulfovibrionales bacterium]MCL0086510.1 UDP-2,3-diacylglucosamine diphosphatase LpxI [Thermodesulfovibrionales bacterium]